MADFIARLAERTLGVAPVVQPLIASVFAPGPASQSLGLEWDSEATTSSGDLDRSQAPPAMETSAGWPEDMPIVSKEDQSDLAPGAPGQFQETPDIPPVPHHPGGPASVERGVISAREDREDSSLAVPGRTRRAPDGPPEPRDEYVPASHPVSPEDLPSGTSVVKDVSSRATSRPVETLVDRGPGATPAPQPSPGTQESVPGSEAWVQPHPVRDAPAGQPEDMADVRQEDQSDLTPGARRHFQETPNVQPEPRHPAEPGPTRGDEAVSTSPRTLPEDLSSAKDVSKRATSRPITSPSPRPSPDARAPSEEETRPVRDAPTGLAEDKEGDHRSLSPVTLERASEDRPYPSHPREPGSLEGPAMSGREDRRDPPQTTTGPSRIPSETRPEALRRAEPTRREDLPTAQRVLPANLPLDSSAAEDRAYRTNPRLVGTLLGHDQGTTLSPRPSPGTQASPDANGGAIESAPNHPAPPDVPSVAPGTVRPRLNVHVKRDSREPGVAAPESSAPSIRVAIGRIEVRATTPPPPPMPPERWTVPDPPGPALSLDDYLKQRNGGR